MDIEGMLRVDMFLDHEGHKHEHEHQNLKLAL